MTEWIQASFRWKLAWDARVTANYKMRCEFKVEVKGMPSTPSDPRANLLPTIQHLWESRYEPWGARLLASPVLSSLIGKWKGASVRISQLIR